MYLAGARQQMQLHIRIRQAIGVHGLQSLQEEKEAQDGQPQQGVASVSPNGDRTEGRCIVKMTLASGPGFNNIPLPSCVALGSFLRLSEPASVLWDGRVGWFQHSCPWLL